MRKIFACLALITLVTSSALAQSVPADVEQRIRQIYADKYPGNFSMQKVLINDQFDSYKFIQRWNSEYNVSREILYKFKEIYDQKYPYNFSMQKVLIQDQVKSYLDLNR